MRQSLFDQHQRMQAMRNTYLQQSHSNNQSNAGHADKYHVNQYELSKIQTQSISGQSMMTSNHYIYRRLSQNEYYSLCSRQQAEQQREYYQQAQMYYSQQQNIYNSYHTSELCII